MRRGGGWALAAVAACLWGAGFAGESRGPADDRYRKELAMAAETGRPPAVTVHKEDGAYVDPSNFGPLVPADAVVPVKWGERSWVALESEYAYWDGGKMYKADKDAGHYWVLGRQEGLLADKGLKRTVPGADKLPVVAVRLRNRKGGYTDASPDARIKSRKDQERQAEALREKEREREREKEREKEPAAADGPRTETERERELREKYAKSLSKTKPVTPGRNKRDHGLSPGQNKKQK